MSKYLLSLAVLCICCISFDTHAGNVMKDTIVNGQRIELHVLPAEPFFTKEEVKAKKIKSGMLILGGEKPLALEDSTHPNHHLVVHVFDTKTKKAITKAKVQISFQLSSEKGKLINLPIVTMQAIGKDEQSTHYGNNVAMPDGSYDIQVVVDGKTRNFVVDVSSSTGKK
jgi:hypothetical protein